MARRQRAFSRSLDRLLPARLREDGSRDFALSFAPAYLRPGITIYDIGGGRHPFPDAATKRRLNITLFGIDIDQRELDLAPADSYDHTICADICSYQGNADADLLICQAVLEHVRDVEAALRRLHSILRPGGMALLFNPSGNAPFARLNRILPDRLRRALLVAMQPDAERRGGFPAFYDRCTPNDFRRMATACGFVVEDERFYFTSSYFMSFVPTYLLWRAWVLLAVLLRGHQAA